MSLALAAPTAAQTPTPVTPGMTPYLLFFRAQPIGRDEVSVTRTAEAFIEGFRSMAFAAVLIGVARAIFVECRRWIT